MRILFLESGCRSSANVQACRTFYISSWVNGQYTGPAYVLCGRQAIYVLSLLLSHRGYDEHRLETGATTKPLSLYY